MSVLELPTSELLRLQPIEKMDNPTTRLWLVRVLASGISFLVCALLVGRLAEGLAPGTGGAALVTFALGSSISGLAASNFGHVTAGLLAFGSLPARVGPAAAGGGSRPGPRHSSSTRRLRDRSNSAVYVVLRGRHELAAFALGLVPGLALLLAYDQLAFGAPCASRTAISTTALRSSREAASSASTVRASSRATRCFLGPEGAAGRVAGRHRCGLGARPPALPPLPGRGDGMRRGGRVLRVAQLRVLPPLRGRVAVDRASSSRRSRSWPRASVRPSPGARG